MAVHKLLSRVVKPEEVDYGKRKGGMSVAKIKSDLQ